MIKPSCYLCNSKQIKVLYTISPWLIVRCEKCRFIFVNPKPSNKFLKKYYSKFIVNIFEKNKITLKDSKHTLSILEKFRGARKKLLDIGCGNGTFMLEALKYGWLPVGIDPSSELVNYVKKNTNLIVYRKSIHDYKTNNKCDLITMNQVIEHFTDPISVIRKCKKLLDRLGLLYISTPNISSYVSRIRKSEFDYLIPPEHLSYFNKATLSKLLESEKFKILYIDSWSYPVDFAGLVKYLLGKRHQYNQNTKLISIETNNWEKKLKYIIFDKLICRIFYKLLNVNYGGTNIEILAQKI